MRCHGASLRSVARGHAGLVAGTDDVAARAMGLRLVGPEADDGSEPVEARPTKLSLADARLRILAIQDAVDAVLTWIAPTLLTVQRTGGTERVLAACESHVVMQAVTGHPATGLNTFSMQGSQ